jgi:hypothetical protein
MLSRGLSLNVRVASFHTPCCLGMAIVLACLMPGMPPVVVGTGDE